MTTLLQTAALDELRSVLGDDFLELSRLFAQQVEIDVANLNACHAQQDMQRLNRQAHALKGACANMGAELLAQQAYRVEQAAKTADLPTIDDAMAQIPDLARQTLDAMRASGYLAD